MMQFLVAMNMEPRLRISISISITSLLLQELLAKISNQIKVFDVALAFLKKI